MSKLETKLFSFHENVFTPCQSTIQVDAKVFDFIRLVKRVMLFNVTAGQEYFFRVNVTWIDLDSLAFIRQVFSHVWTLSRLLCNRNEATIGLRLTAMITVSSAYVAIEVAFDSGRSAVNRKYNRGPRTLPWGHRKQWSAIW